MSVPSWWFSPRNPIYRFGERVGSRAYRYGYSTGRTISGQTPPPSYHGDRHQHTTPSEKYPDRRRSRRTPPPQLRKPSTSKKGISLPLSLRKKGGEIAESLKTPVSFKKTIMRKEWWKTPTALELPGLSEGYKFLSTAHEKKALQTELEGKTASLQRTERGEIIIPYGLTPEAAAWRQRVEHPSAPYKKELSYEEYERGKARFLESRDGELYFKEKFFRPTKEGQEIINLSERLSTQSEYLNRGPFGLIAEYRDVNKAIVGRYTSKLPEVPRSYSGSFVTPEQERALNMMYAPVSTYLSKKYPAFGGAYQDYLTTPAGFRLMTPLQKATAGKEFSIGSYEGIKNQPLKTAATTAAFFALPAVTKGAGAALKGIGAAPKSVRGVLPEITKYAPKAIGYGLGAAYGGATGYRVYSLPVEERYAKMGEIAATELGPMIAGYAAGEFVFPRIHGYALTRGKEFIPIKELGTEYGYPTRAGLTEKQITASFKKSTLAARPTSWRGRGNIGAELYPKSSALPGESLEGVYGWHAIPRTYPKGFEVPIGSSELPGMYHAPILEGYFTKAGQGITAMKGIGLDFTGYPTPVAIRTHALGIEAIPRSVRVGGYPRMGKWVTSEGRLGKFWEPLMKQEYEAILPIGTKMTRMPVKYYTKIKSVRTPIHQYEAGGIGKGLTAESMMGDLSALGYYSEGFDIPIGLGYISNYQQPIKKSSYTKPYSMPSKPSIPSYPSMPSMPSKPSIPSYPSIPITPSVPSEPFFPSYPIIPRIPLPYPLKHKKTKRRKKRKRDEFGWFIYNPVPGLNQVKASDIIPSKKALMRDLGANFKLK